MQASERAHTNTTLNQKAYGILKILEAFQNESNNQLEEVVLTIDVLYTSEQAPSGWHLKEQLRKQLRQIRALVFKLQLDNWKDIPNKVDEYAIKHYARF